MDITNGTVLLADQLLQAIVCIKEQAVVSKHKSLYWTLKYAKRRLRESCDASPWPRVPTNSRLTVLEIYTVWRGKNFNYAEIFLRTHPIEQNVLFLDRLFIEFEKRVCELHAIEFYKDEPSDVAKLHHSIERAFDRCADRILASVLREYAEWRKVELNTIG